MNAPDDLEAPDLADPPAFCPRCGVARKPGGALCAECGDRLIEQGYCGVCERFWLRRVGDPCPKHEIPLETGPAAGLAPGYVDWVTIASYAQPIQAQAPRIRLEAEEIPTFLEGEHVASHGAYHVATGGVRLQVPAELADEARVILSQTWSHPIEDDDLDDAWDELAPEPGARRRAVMRALIVLILLMPALATLMRFLMGAN